MHSLLLIGAGNIGRRHLQGVLKSSNQLNIVVVEPFETNRNLVATAIDEVGGVGQHSVNVVAALNEVALKQFHIVIVATSADVRKNVLVDFFNEHNTKYLILEKVLFQHVDDYKTIAKLLYEKKITTFVNCTRRYFPHYISIQQYLQGSVFMEMEVTGSNWGLACNTIHLLDLFNYFNQHTNYSFNADEIDSTIHESKRKGFIELTGTIKTKPDNLYQFKATSTFKDGNDLIIRVKSNKAEFVVNETKGTIQCRAVLGNENDELNNLKIVYKALPLSQSANFFVDDLLNTGSCLLTDYYVSAQLHVSLITTYLAHLKTNQYDLMDDKICPIT
jgi:hypothetical protein